MYILSYFLSSSRDLLSFVVLQLGCGGGGACVCVWGGGGGSLCWGGRCGHVHTSLLLVIHPRFAQSFSVLRLGQGMCVFVCVCEHYSEYNSGLSTSQTFM